MACIDLEITSNGTTVIIPAEKYGEDMSQTYENISTQFLARDTAGGAITQSVWGKLKTTISGTGKFPSALLTLSRDYDWTIKCIAPITGWPGATHGTPFIHDQGTGKYPVLVCRVLPGSPRQGGQLGTGNTWSLEAEEV